MSSLQRRLESLEAVSRPQESSPETRERMKENLDRIARLRRSDSPEAAAELEDFRAGVERQIAKRRGECGR